MIRQAGRVTSQPNLLMRARAHARAHARVHARARAFMRARARARVRRARARYYMAHFDVTGRKFLAPPLFCQRCAVTCLIPLLPKVLVFARGALLHVLPPCCKDALSHALLPLCVTCRTPLLPKMHAYPPFLPNMPSDMPYPPFDRRAPWHDLPPGAL